ncbi:MAG: phage tail tube protein [Melioribacteraceae bacterium]|nr:phage tail tube protein [Melioribacteraceae bacterium]
MAITSTNYTDISYIEEVTPGVIPDTAPTNFQIIPTTGGAPMFERATQVSDVIRSDRQTDDLVVVDADVTGEIEFESAYGPYKPLFQALLRGPVDTVTTPGSEIVKNGNLAPKTYTFVKRVLGIIDPTYFYYKGCVLSQVAMNFETGAILTGTQSVLGRTEVTGTDGTTLPITSQAFLNPPAYTVLNSVEHVATSSGVWPATTEFDNMSLTINNNSTNAKAIGTLGAIDVADFTLEVTGDISIYFQDLDIYTLFSNSANFDLNVTLTDASGNILLIEMPFCKFETLDSPIEGKDNFYMMDGTFRALRDPVNDYMIQMTWTDV